MSRNQKILIGLGILFFFGILYIAYGTDICRYYKNASIANAPTLPKGSRMLVSSLIKPKRLDFVAFKIGDSSFGRGKRIQRLVGVPGDTLVIENGNLFINGNDIDESLNLAHAHKIHIEDARSIKEDLRITSDGFSFYGSQNDSTLVFISKEVSNKNHLESFRLIAGKDYFDISINTTFDQKWNKDHFGPLILKNEEYFVLGDNRDNSEDSRYIGIINKKQIIGKAIRF